MKEYRIPLGHNTVVLAFEKLPIADCEMDIVIQWLAIFRKALTKKDYRHPDDRRKGTRKGVLYRKY